MPVLGGDEKLLVPRGQNPRFSSDGKWLACWEGIYANVFGPGTWGKSYIVSVGDGVIQQIAADFSLAVSPIWSPDGRRLMVYGSARGDPQQEGAPDWWIVSIEGRPAIKTGALDVLRRQGHSVSPLDLGPYGIRWVGNSIFFSSRWGDSANIWKIPISPEDWKITQFAQRLTSGTGSEVQPALAGSQIVFAGVSENIDLWRLPIDADRGKVTGALQRLTHDLAPDDQPSSSLEGTRVAFRSLRSGNADIWVKDLETGRETSLVKTPLNEESPRISGDGTSVAYVVAENQKRSIYVIATAGGLPQSVCENCDAVWDAFRNGLKILYKPSGQSSVWVHDSVSGQKAEFLRHPKHRLWQATFSPDNQWTAFLTSGPGIGAHVWIAPLRSETPAPEREWIRVTEGESVDKPRWSPDGNRIYFTSHRDGFRCLWAQQLEPSTKRPFGPPTDVSHFHGVRRSLVTVGPAFAEISVARDQVVLPLGERTGNIWMTTLDLK